MNDLKLIEQKSMRDECIERLDVLEKVKELFLIPELDVMTTRQVAEYYEVGYDAIQKCYQRHKQEIDTDGISIKTIDDFRTGHDVQTEKSSQKRGGVEFHIPNKMTFIIPYGKGTRCFSKRAILRIGMLLRDSEIAKEVRSQLLNVFEHSTAEQRTDEIFDEQQLLLDLARSYVGRDFDALATANQNYIAYQNRHITALRSDNKALAADILEWEDRSKLNRAIRIFARKAGMLHGMAWNLLYNELKYKHHIGLTQRGSSPYLQHIREDEWSLVVKSFAAICEDNNISSSDIIERSKFSASKYQGKKQRGEILD